MKLSSLHIIAAVGIVLACGCSRVFEQPKPVVTTTAPQKRQIDVVEVEARPITESVELPATLIGLEQAKLMAKIPGYVKEVHVNIGDEVAEDDILVTLEAPELDQMVQKQEKLHSEAVSDIRLAKAQLKAAEADLAGEQAMIDLRRSELQRMQELVASGALNDVKREEAEFALKSAEASMTQHESAVQVAKARVDMAASHAEVVEAQLDQARTMASYQQIRAPFSGMITKRNVDPGAFVEPVSGMESMPLVELAIVDTLRAVFHITMDDVSQVHVGDKVFLNIIGSPGETFEGKVSRVSGVFDEDSRMMRAESDLENPVDPNTGQPALRAGSYGTIQIVSEEAIVPAVPKTAIAETAGKPTVIVVTKDGVCLTTVVEPAIDGGDVVGVSSGVSAGDRVVADNQAQLKSGEQLSADEIQLVTY